MNLSHISHTGRHLPHHHTSYASLLFVLLLAGLLLIGISWESLAGSPPPGHGSIGLSGTMPAKPPKIAPTITSPSSGITINVSPVTVVGICASDTIIELYKNDVYAGAGACGTDKTFSIQIDLLYGNNTLIARAYDALDQASPDSNNVNIFYTNQQAGIGVSDSTNTLAKQLVLHSSAIFRGVEQNREMSIPLDIIGGTAPFSVIFSYDGSSQDLITRSSNASFSQAHTFKRPGVYNLTIRASDITGQSAVLTSVVIVNGPTQVVSSTGSDPTTNGSGSKLLVAWPLYLLSIVAVISFWLGERREKHLIMRFAG
jgi:hypothetical protein